MNYIYWVILLSEEYAIRFQYILKFILEVVIISVFILANTSAQRLNLIIFALKGDRKEITQVEYAVSKHL